VAIHADGNAELLEQPAESFARELRALI